METIEDRVFQMIPEMRAYRRLARAILVLALKDWCGVGVVVRRADAKQIAQERACYQRDARRFWHSSWARTLCEFAGLNPDLLLEAMQQAENDRTRMRNIARRLHGLPLAGV